MSDKSENPTSTGSSYEDDEITLKELIEKIIEYTQEIWQNKWLIILLGIPLALYFGYKAKMAIVTYNAQLTYTLNDGGGGGGALAGILGSFGLSKGGKVNLDRIIELSKSRNIMHKVLFTKISLDTMDGKYDYIANHIIQLHNFDDEWSEKNPQLVGFSFRSDDIDSFNTVELKALKMLYGKIIGSKNVKSPLFSNGYNEDTGILTISAKTVDEELSIAFTKLVYNQLKEYYVSSTTKGSAYTFQYAKEKTDSIFSLLRAKEYQLSKFDDSHRFLTDPNLLTQRKLIETEIFKLKTMYGESTKNLEIANYTLEAGMPDITIIDEPIPPIDAMSESWLISFIKGGILGGLIGISFVLGRKIIRDALAT